MGQDLGPPQVLGQGLAPGPPLYPYYVFICVHESTLGWVASHSAERPYSLAEAGLGDTMPKGQGHVRTKIRHLLLHEKICLLLQERTCFLLKEKTCLLVQEKTCHALQEKTCLLFLAIFPKHKA